MDTDGSRTNSTLGSGVSDGSTKYAHSSPTIQANRIQSFNDISSNSLGKMDATTSRPCAIIGPDRVLPSNAGDVYLKKAVAPWPCQENVYRHTTDYQSKIPEYQPNRNISPRQTFQENMQRIMVPPTYSSIKIPEESSSKNTKLNMPHEAKYCDVPYNNSVNNELKSVRNPDIPITNMNPAFSRSVPPYGWPPGVNVRPLRPYGAPDYYQYSEYPSCAGTRPMVRQHQALNGESTQIYPDHLYQESNIRFKPYPLAKERHQQVRYDYINNYPNTFHPSNPFPSHRYDLQKSIHGHPYPVYPQIPVKYLDRRIHEPIPESYQRSSNTPNFNMAYRNQPVAPPYGPLSGSCVQNKPYPPDGTLKPNNKLHFDPNSKVYVDLEPKHNKGYSIPDNIYLNEMNHHQSLRGDILLPPNSALSMHTVPQHAIYRKDNTYPKNFEYNIQYRNVDQPMNNSLPRFPLHYSPNTLAISPSDSNTSNDTALTLGAPQEDCGYVSQSSTTSVRSLDSYNIQATHENLRRHNYNTYGIHRNNGKEMASKRKSSTSDKKNINVRQFLQMWNEGDDDVSEPNKETVTSNNPTKNDEEQLYVLGLVNVPSNEIGKYEHIQKISKLPENIKGYNSLELLNQYEELLEPSNTEKYNSKPLMTRQSNLSLRNVINKEHVTVPRPISPLDVEAKISQSVIHKEVGCNFEIKPCSPEMLNVEVATPVQNILGERSIEKMVNPVITHSPLLHVDENDIKTSNIIKNSSCKMTNHPYTPEPSSGKIKSNNYSTQDLETNAGVCLASLPQLDNDLELNFPEINQQFINANKKASNAIMSPKCSSVLGTDQKPNMLHEKSGLQQINLLSPQTPSSIEKEVSKLSKYRKTKKVEPSTPSPNDFPKTIISPLTTQRIDSVIIKNPDNIKLQDIQSNTCYGLNTLLEDHNDHFNNNNISLEKAIDFSLNKIDVNIPIENNVLNNMNCPENTVIEDHCNTVTTYNNLNAEVIPNEQDFTLIHEKDKDSADKGDEATSLEFEKSSDEEHEHPISTDIVPEDNGIQQDNFSRKSIQNIGDESRDEVVTSPEIISEKCSIEQDIFSLNMQQETQEPTHINLEGNILSCQENDVENMKMKQDEFQNACQISNSIDNNSFEEMVSDNSDINTEQNFENLIGDDASKTECPALSVIQTRVPKEEELMFPDNSTHSINNEISKPAINESENEISDITTQKLSEATSGFSNISLPIIDNIPDKDSELFDTITESKIENIEEFTVSNTDKLTNIINENKRNQTNEELNTCVQQNDDDLSSDFSADPKITEITTEFYKVPPDHSVLQINGNNIDSNLITNSCSSIKEYKSTEQNYDNENQHFHNIVENVPSVKDKVATNMPELNDNFEAKSFDSTLLEHFDSEKLLEPIQSHEVTDEKIGSITENENENLSTLSQTIPINDKINTYIDSQINETSNEPAKKNDDELNTHEENNREHETQNIVDTSLKTNFPQNEQMLINNNFNIDINVKEPSNKNNSISNEIKNYNINTEMSTDDKTTFDSSQISSMLNVETRNCAPVCRKSVKIYKNLFSPWVQKLTMNTEGICVTNKEIPNKEVFNESVDRFQTTSKFVDNKEATSVNEDIKQNLKGDICEDENYVQENMIDTSDATLVLILSSDNPKDDSRPLEKTQTLRNCIETTPNETLKETFEESSKSEIHTKVNHNFLGSKPQKILKRSLSESAIDNRSNEDANLLIPTKRRKVNDILQSNITAEDLCNIVQSNRRNSISTFYNEDSVYILIDNDLIITEENEESDKICFPNTDECIPSEEGEQVFEKIDNASSDSYRRESFESDDYLNDSKSNDEKNTEESWYEDVACIETVFSDDVAEDITIDEYKSPKITNDEDSDNDDSHIFEEMRASAHINKIRNIYGDSVSNDNVQVLETLYRTPQMDVNKTLVDIESHNVETCFLQEETLHTHDQEHESDKLKNVYLSQRNCLIDDKENLLNDSILESTALKTYCDIKENNVNVLFSDEKSLDDRFLHSCETSNDNFISNSQKDTSHYSYSSSPEVSSTTSEEKGHLLKITNYNESRSSQINEITDDMNKISYKLTENQEYRTYKSNFSSTRTLITKAAQKYIPPLKETIGDLKVKLPLPQHHLNKLKQLKKSKIEPKITENIIRYKNRNLKTDVPKKVKPKFEDVLKSIDEIQFQKRKDKLKKSKSEIPKVVIKKGEDGAHYTSSKINNNEVYNPDLTGRKWQPWVFLEKNNFIDRMAIKKKHKAIYCHRKQSYILAEKFRKYKSVYNAKFVITQPKSSTTHGNLKYTIRLQHK